MIKEIDLDSLSREDYINIILLFIDAFKYNFSFFTDIEKDFIKDAIDRSIYKRNEKI